MSYLTLALGPVVAIFFFFRIKDRYDKEPFRRLILTAGIGALSAIPVVIVEMLWGHTLLDASSLSIQELSFMAFVEIGITEEFFKAVAFFSTAYWSKHMNEPYDGLIYSVSAALGFAAVENVLYVISGGILTAVVRAITAVPAHAMFGTFIGYFAGRAKFSKHPALKPILILFGFTISVFAHGLYDLIALWPEPLTWLWLIPLLGAMVVVSLLLIRDARKRSPFRPAVDADNKYTGYTVSGEPLSPEMIAKLEKEARKHERHSQLISPVVKDVSRPDEASDVIQEQAKNQLTNPEESQIIPPQESESGEDNSKGKKPYFLDDYFKN
ncbi:PrsW family intramembrane metalloprotease [bacterium]|nr:PrsW family intramembrane metalloprotease [bacterium]